MTTQLKLRDKVYEVPSGTTVRDAMLRLGIEPDSVIPTRDGELMTDDELLREGEVIRLVAVISGGGRGACGASGDRDGADSRRSRSK